MKYVKSVQATNCKHTQVTKTKHTSTAPCFPKAEKPFERETCIATTEKNTAEKSYFLPVLEIC